MQSTPSNDSQRTSSSLLLRARNQDDGAWERIVMLYSPLVYRWCIGWGLRPQDAENVGQEVFFSVSKNLDSFQRRAGSTFRGWLWTITRNKYVDFLRGFQNAPVGIGGSDAMELIANVEELEEPSPEKLSAELAMLYKRAVELIRGEFSDQDWRAFCRVTIDNVCASDVAAELNISKNTVYLAKSRILKRLRDEFSDLIELDSI